jgi:hypothetical protein
MFKTSEGTSYLSRQHYGKQGLWYDDDGSQCMEMESSNFLMAIEWSEELCLLEYNAV